MFPRKSETSQPSCGAVVILPLSVVASPDEEGLVTDSEEKPIPLDWMEGIVTLSEEEEVEESIAEPVEDLVEDSLEEGEVMSSAEVVSSDESSVEDSSTENS